ncbi:MAG: hypothetical protein FJ242_06475 [Nitrospira sp.]|nr:hypothetical protein [Nitrospira sp.]
MHGTKDIDLISFSKANNGQRLSFPPRVIVIPAKAGIHARGKLQRESREKSTGFRVKHGMTA